MSIDLWLEADDQLPEDALGVLLREAGAVQFELENGSVGFAFQSGPNAFPRGADGAPRIKAEDPRGLGFAVASRCVFRPTSGEYDECMADLRQLLESVVERTGAHFVVSFQLEETLFLNSGKGLQCL
ncbi:hypothetical protein [Pelomonas sp. KK5]|uniref:hypothetical protein n=1 Tax=Pelomonas sp. KK5 TaxID=1855730 RepID=UPI00117C9FAF|nr:hypothetical protein [Pelomonas sp. KK5]